MESITSLAQRLQSANLTTPAGATITVSEGDAYRWEPKTATVFFAAGDMGGAQTLLHELGHALLGHNTYSKDIALIKMERAAWERARLLAAAYGVTISDDTIEDSLDSYRDWLHARSLCPNCGATGMQSTAKTYQCPNCQHIWRVNEARTCGLKRYSVTVA